MSETFKWCLDRTRLKTFDKQVFYVNRNGTKVWYFNGRLHMENGPAVEYVNGVKWWYLRGQPHTEDGHVISHAVIM